MATISNYASMASAAYDANPSVTGWTAGTPLYDSNSGLRTVVFTNGTLVVVSFRGTDNLSDLVEDAQLTLGMNTAMYPVGEAIAAAMPGQVILTGHSLGGAVAQTVGNRLELPFVTFNAPGVALIASRNIGSADPRMAAVRLAGGAASAVLNPGQALRDARAAFHISSGVNYRLSNDVVSATGVHYGTVTTLPSGTLNPKTAHGIATMIGVLSGVSAGRTSYPA